MAPLRVALAALALIAAAPAGAQSVLNWRPYVEQASARFGVPVEWVERVVQAESGGRTVLDGRPITSHAGAMGLMQIMPATWADLRARLGLGTNPHHPRDNIMAGTFYLRLMYERFGYPGMFAAYNAGPGRYSEYVSRGRALPSETRAYLATVTGGSAPMRRPATSIDAMQSSPIFFALGVTPSSAGSDTAAPSLFVPISADRSSKADR